MPTLRIDHQTVRTAVRDLHEVRRTVSQLQQLLVKLDAQETVDTESEDWTNLQGFCEYLNDWGTYLGETEGEEGEFQFDGFKDMPDGDQPKLPAPVETTHLVLTVLGENQVREYDEYPPMHRYDKLIHELLDAVRSNHDQEHLDPEIIQYCIDRGFIERKEK